MCLCLSDEILPLLPFCTQIYSGTFALIALTAGETVEVFTTRAEGMEECTRNMSLITDHTIPCDEFSVRTALTLSLTAGLFLVSNVKGKGKGGDIWVWERNGADVEVKDRESVKSKNEQGVGDRGPGIWG